MGRSAVGCFLSSLALAIALGGCGDLSKAELNRGAESLSALAAQGTLIAKGVAQDATKSTYTRVMARTLAGEAQHEAEKLADATAAPGTGAQRNEAVAIAGRIAALYSQLQTFPGDERHGLVVERRMSRVKDRADALVSRLRRSPA